jgi:hypothetical protein
LNEEKDDKAVLVSLERAIEEAHRQGTLFFLAVELVSMLHEHHGRYGQISARELENLIARAAEKMISRIE